MAKLYFTLENNLLNLWLSSPTQKVNSIGGEIALPSRVKLEQIIDGNSIVNFWVERPVLKEGKIIFSGIIPGGYQGESVQIFSLNLSSLGRAQIVVSRAQVLLHDGLGTATIAETPTFTIPATTVTGENFATDTIPPEPFTPIITSDPSIFEGKKFLVFSAQDKQSGISHYEVAEDDTWQRSESPYLIINQELTEKIEVKAVDLAGNEREVIAFSPPLTFSDYLFWTIIIVVIILCSLVIKKLFFRR